MPRKSKMQHAAQKRFHFNYRTFSITCSEPVLEDSDEADSELDDNNIDEEQNIQQRLLLTDLSWSKYAHLDAKRNPYGKIKSKFNI